MKHRTLVCVLAATLITGVAHAQVPPLVNYQGRVAVSGTNFEGSGQFKFALVNADGSQTFWSNDGTSAGGSEPASAITLNVAKGLYSVLLGDTILGNMTAIPANVFTNPDVRLRVWFNDGVNGSQLLTPDQRLAPAAYLSDGAVTTAAIAPGAVTGNSVAAGSLSGNNLASGSLNFSHLTVPAAPNPGQVLGFDGNGFTWTTPPGGPGLWSQNGTSAYYNDGNVGIGTSSPAAKLEISGLNGNTLLYATAPVPNLILRDSNAANAVSVIGGNAGGLRFFTNSFWTGLNPDAFMALDGQGRLGLGTSTPNHRLSILGGPGWTSSFWKGAIELEDGAALGWRTNAVANRFGMGHSGGGFYMFRTASDPGTTNNPPLVDFFLSDDGRVALTGTFPNHHLSIFDYPGGPRWTSASWIGAVELSSGSAVAWRPNASGQSFGFGQTGGGFYMFRTNSSPGATGAPPNYDFFLNDAGNIGIGTTFPASKLDVNGTITTKVLTITGGADIAEPFPMKEESIPKGSVVVIDSEHPGRLKRSSRAYDRRVAGIISGANGINPGIALHQEGALEGDQNVALSGRVYVEADASAGAIEPGDLLTTSNTPGHAMKVSDHSRAQGAVIGKAMSSLREGTGLVLVLVTLQ